MKRFRFVVRKNEYSIFFHIFHIIFHENTKRRLSNKSIDFELRLSNFFMYYERLTKAHIECHWKRQKPERIRIKIHIFRNIAMSKCLSIESMKANGRIWALIKLSIWYSFFGLFDMLLKWVAAFVGGAVLNYKPHYFDMLFIILMVYSKASWRHWEWVFQTRFNSWFAFDAATFFRTISDFSPIHTLPPL